MIDIGSKVVVVKGSKSPNKVQPGTVGTVFWKKRYDSHGAFGILRIGIKTNNNDVFFVNARDTKELKGN